jgi:hypothetical protein
MTTIKPSRGGWIKRKAPPGTNPKASKALKAHWADPEWRAKTIASNRAGEVEHRKERKRNPEKFSRGMIPNGMTRAQAAPLWAEARLTADRFIKQMQDNGELPNVDFIVPDTDEAKGVAALHEAAVLALGPGAREAKLAAIRTVLEWTKAKPATRSKIDLNTSEDWLAEIAADASDK